MNETIKIGFLPFYIELYDRVLPQYHDEMQKNADFISREYKKLGFTVETAPICRLEKEFRNAILSFEENGCEVIVTLHLAYSPSLESAKLLAETELPVVVLDTTPDLEYGFDYGKKLMYNHGIHGVQDMCNLLIRNKKSFLIDAGHLQNSDVMKRSSDSIFAAAMAFKMTHLRVGTVGGEFHGMGDFVVPDGTFGMQKIAFSDAGELTEAEIREEMSADLKQFEIGTLSPESHHRSTHSGLRLRKWAEKEKLDAFTVCFLGIEKKNGWETVPFIEASKALARGIGYAGEGDTLTAGLVAALMRSYPETTFSEMFCPDWNENRIFTSHMGEVNLNLLSARPLLSERAYFFSDTGTPVFATGCLKAGKALLINLAPGPDKTFRLITANVEFTAPEGPSRASIDGWFVPYRLPVADFLGKYSRNGGTHHIAVTYDAKETLIEKFAWLMKWEYTRIC